MARFGCIARSALLAMLACAAALHLPRAHAEPVPAGERIPVDLRRTTLVVRDIDASLPLYRDALGLHVVYDEKISGAPATDGKPASAGVRLVLMRANDDFIGLLGLMQRLDAPVTPVPPPVFQKAQPGGHILVINCADLESRIERVRATPGVRIAEDLHRIEYPAPGGKGVIPVLFSAIWDADGNYVELNRILGTPAGRPSAAPAIQPMSGSPR
jgi:catechol 2,3-dioxygenase-like lactoylglutathione lyase family enzyme